MSEDMDDHSAWKSCCRDLKIRIRETGFRILLCVEFALRCVVGTCCCGAMTIHRVVVQERTKFTRMSSGVRRLDDRTVDLPKIAMVWTMLSARMQMTFHLPSSWVVLDPEI